MFSLLSPRRGWRSQKSYKAKTLPNSHSSKGFSPFKRTRRALLPDNKRSALTPANSRRTTKLSLDCVERAKQYNEYINDNLINTVEYENTNDSLREQIRDLKFTTDDLEEPSEIQKKANILYYFYQNLRLTRGSIRNSDPNSITKSPMWIEILAIHKDNLYELFSRLAGDRVCAKSVPGRARGIKRRRLQTKRSKKRAKIKKRV